MLPIKGATSVEDGKMTYTITHATFDRLMFFNPGLVSSDLHDIHGIGLVSMILETLKDNLPELSQINLMHITNRQTIDTLENAYDGLLQSRKWRPLFEKYFPRKTTSADWIEGWGDEREHKLSLIREKFLKEEGEEKYLEFQKEFNAYFNETPFFILMKELGFNPMIHDDFVLSPDLQESQNLDIGGLVP